MLLYDPPLSQTAQKRLDILRRTDDGFLIAEQDLELRGGGDPLGLKQSGFPRLSPGRPDRPPGADPRRRRRRPPAAAPRPRPGQRARQGGEDPAGTLRLAAGLGEGLTHDACPVPASGHRSDRGDPAQPARPLFRGHRGQPRGGAPDRAARDTAWLGSDRPATVRALGWLGLLRLRFMRSTAEETPIWHARRNDEMIVGLLLRALGWRLGLVFTWAGQRRPRALTRALISRNGRGDLHRPRLRRLPGCAPAHHHHGVDIERFQPPQDRLLAWQAGGLAGRRGVGCFGRVRPSKGVDVFVEAMCRVLPRHPDFVAVIIGENHHHPARLGLRQRLRASAEAAGAGRADHLPRAAAGGGAARLVRPRLHLLLRVAQRGVRPDHAGGHGLRRRPGRGPRGGGGDRGQGRRDGLLVPRGMPRPWPPPSSG